MSFYWCVASPLLGYWIVESASEFCFEMIEKAIDSAIEKNENIQFGRWRRILLIGKKKPVEVSSKKPIERANNTDGNGGYRWLLITDPSNAPAYIVKTSNQIYPNFSSCKNGVKRSVTVPIHSTDLEEPLIVFHKLLRPQKQD